MAAGEKAVLVSRLGQVLHGAIVPGEQGRRQRRWAAGGVAVQVEHKGRICLPGFVRRDKGAVAEALFQDVRAVADESSHLEVLSLQTDVPGLVPLFDQYVQ